MPKPKLLRVDQAAKYMEVSRATLYHWLKDGLIPSVLVWTPGKGRLRFVAQEALDQYLKGLTQPEIQNGWKGKEK